MVWIPDETFEQGAIYSDKMRCSMQDLTIPAQVDGLFMDQNEMTNGQFSLFVDELAEKEIVWEGIKSNYLHITQNLTIPFYNQTRWYF